MITGDVDGDGDLDILLPVSVNNGSGLLTWHENTDGQGSFGAQQIITNVGSGFIRSFGFVDVDGDNNNDIVFSIDDGSSGTVGKVGWLKNIDGNGDFSTVQEIDDEDVNWTLVIDIDGDEDNDIITGAFQGNTIAWYENLDGLGDFGSKQIIAESLSSYTIQSLASGDLDNDGDLDLLAAYEFDINLAFYDNIDGFGSFAEEQPLIEATEAGYAIAVGDINGDSRLDILLSAVGGNEPLVWSENQGLSKNRITGVVRLDLEANNCLESTRAMDNVKITSNHDLVNYSTFTNSNGVSQLYVEYPGVYTTSIADNLPSYFTITPVSHISDFDDSGDIDVLNFCVTPNQEVTDLNIAFFPTNNARPGFVARYLLVYENVGTTVMDGDISLAFNGNIMELVDASETIASQEAGSVTFNYTDLKPI